MDAGSWFMTPFWFKCRFFAMSLDCDGGTNILWIYLYRKFTYYLSSSLTSLSLSFIMFWTRIIGDNDLLLHLGGDLGGIFVFSSSVITWTFLITEQVYECVTSQWFWSHHTHLTSSSWSFNNFSSLSLALSFDLLMGNFPVSLSTLSEHWRDHCCEAIFHSLLKIVWEKHITLFRIIIFFTKYICKLVTT